MFKVYPVRKGCLSGLIFFLCALCDLCGKIFPFVCCICSAVIRVLCPRNLGTTCLDECFNLFLCPLCGKIFSFVYKFFYTELLIPLHRLILSVHIYFLRIPAVPHPHKHFLKLFINFFILNYHSRIPALIKIVPLQIRRTNPRHIIV